RPRTAAPRGDRTARRAVEGGARGDDPPTDARGRLLGRLVEVPLHDGRAERPRHARGVRRALPGGPRLPGRADRELGPEAPDRDLRPRGGPPGGADGALVP